MARGDIRDRTQRRRHACVAAGVALTLLTAVTAMAQVTTAGGGSLLIWPKVVADEVHDTVIMLVNRTNRAVNATCYYVRGDDASCAMTTFSLMLGGQQPTHWRASAGRPVNPDDPTCSLSNNDCDGAGTDPGPVPAVPSGFAGALVCVEVDATGAPVSGNSLIGTASLQHPTAGDVAQYDALGVPGFDTNNGDGILCLGGAQSDECPNGAEYDGCPGQWALDFVPEGAADPLAGTDSSVHTELTVMPCTQDVRLSDSASVVVDFSVYNEFETLFSASTSVACWATRTLTAINDSAFSAADLGTLHARAVAAVRDAGGGFALVAQEFHSVSGAADSSAATGPHFDPASAQADVMVPPVP
jgi:hypothetical protein